MRAVQQRRRASPVRKRDGNAADASEPARESEQTLLKESSRDDAAGTPWNRLGRMPLKGKRPPENGTPQTERTRQ